MSLHHTFSPLFFCLFKCPCSSPSWFVFPDNPVIWILTTETRASPVVPQGYFQHYFQRGPYWSKDISVVIWLHCSSLSFSVFVFCTHPTSPSEAATAAPNSLSSLIYSRLCLPLSYSATFPPTFFYPSLCLISLQSVTAMQKPESRSLRWKMVDPFFKLMLYQCVSRINLAAWAPVQCPPCYQRKEMFLWWAASLASQSPTLPP